MKLTAKKIREYRENRSNLESGMNEIMNQMKGRYHNYRWDIAAGKDRKSCDIGKLHKLIDEILDNWEDYVRDLNLEAWHEGNDYSRITVINSIARGDADNAAVEAYLKERKELYRDYLYLVMRCSLIQRGYVLATGTAIREKTDYAFLLERAKEFQDHWCVMEYEEDSKAGDGEKEKGRTVKKINFPCNGFEEEFGFHLYYRLVCPEDNIYPGPHLEADIMRRLGIGDENSDFNKYGKALTNEGNRKRIDCRIPEVPAGYWEGRTSEEADEEDKEQENVESVLEGKTTEMAAEQNTEEGKACEQPVDGNPDDDEDYDYDDYDYDEDYEFYGDMFGPYSGMDEESKAAFLEAEANELARQEMKRQFFESLYLEVEEEYVETCQRFARSFEEADPAVIREFYHDIEEAVDLYLLSGDCSVLSNVDQTLDVYSELKKEPWRKASMYARGIAWKKR